MAERIKQEYLPRYEGHKGVIHATYAQAKIFREAFGEDGRFIFHTKEDTKERFQEFLDSPPESGRVLVASGLYEGIDLVEDLGRWQLITKIPWLNLGDPAIKYRSEKDPSWFVWEALKTLLQACGRICRTPTDHGDTYILDESFKRLYNQSEKYELIPAWWREALVFEGEK